MVSLFVRNKDVSWVRVLSCNMVNVQACSKDFGSNILTKFLTSTFILLMKNFKVFFSKTSTIFQRISKSLM